jgi:hypothetical protein
MICPQCGVENEERKKLCESCGNPLSKAEEGSPGAESETSGDEGKRIVRLCPRCHLHFEVGNYCRRCGSPLENADTSQASAMTPGRRRIRNLSSEWFSLTEGKRQVESCLKSLRAKQDTIPEDLFIPIFRRYQAHLESSECRIREIESEFEAIRASASKEIGSLKEELGPIQKRFEEIRSLRRLGGITRRDYVMEKNEIAKEIRARERRLKEYRKAIVLTHVPSKGARFSPLFPGLLRGRLPAVAGGLIIVIGLGITAVWPRFFNPVPPNSPKIAQTKSSVQNAPSAASAEPGEGERIKHLFETIRKANLQKRIDLFMSCYAADLKDRSGKRAATLETWDHFDYIDLAYEFKGQTITGHTAKVRVEWWIKTTQKNGGAPQESRSTSEVSLKKEEGEWKIGEIKPVS